jgi:hypothetical protein
MLSEQRVANHLNPLAYIDFRPGVYPPLPLPNLRLGVPGHKRGDPQENRPKLLKSLEKKPSSPGETPSHSTSITAEFKQIYFYLRSNVFDLAPGRHGITTIHLKNVQSCYNKDAYQT